MIVAALTTIPAAVAVTILVAPSTVNIDAGPVPTPSGRRPTAPIVKRTRQTWAGSVGNPKPYITIRVRRNAITVNATTINAKRVHSLGLARTPSPAASVRSRKRP